MEHAALTIGTERFEVMALRADEAISSLFRYEIECALAGGGESPGPDTDALVGSGATAVTLVPAMAAQAGHVTMLQRSPTYVVSRPSEYGFARRFRRWLPETGAYRATRWRVIAESTLLYRLARSKPRLVKDRIVAMARHELGGDGQYQDEAETEEDVVAGHGALRSVRELPVTTVARSRPRRLPRTGPLRDRGRSSSPRT